MSRYVLDIQAVLRGVRKVAEIGIKSQADIITQRVASSSLPPLAQSLCSGAGSKLNSQVQSFDIEEIASRAGAVFQGLQEQFKIVTGFAPPTPAFVADNGFNYYKSNTVGAGLAREKPASATVLPNGNGNVRPQGEAGEIAKRAEQFMNPPVAPLDQGGDNIDEAPLTADTLKADELAAKGDKNFMKEQTSEVDDKYRQDSSRTFIESDDSSVTMDSIKKVSKIQPGVPVSPDTPL